MRSAVVKVFFCFIIVLVSSRRAGISASSLERVDQPVVWVPYLGARLQDFQGPLARKTLFGAQFFPFVKRSFRSAPSQVFGGASGNLWSLTNGVDVDENAKEAAGHEFDRAADGGGERVCPG
ncbi:MAG: hypothetical protein AAF552_12115 [Pseudomonadota bacterium]